MISTVASSVFLLTVDSWTFLKLDWKTLFVQVAFSQSLQGTDPDSHTKKIRDSRYPYWHAKAFD